MRVAFMLQPRDVFDVKGGGSVTLVTYQLAREIAAKGHEVTLYARQSAGQPLQELTDDGVRIQRLSGDSRRWQSLREVASGFVPAQIPWSMHPGYYSGFLRHFAAAVRHARPDVIHIPTLVQYVPFLRKACPGSVLAFHVHDELIAHLPLSWVASRLGQADLVICVNNHRRDQLRARHTRLEAGIRTLHHSGHPEMFEPGVGSRDITKPTLLYAGRLSPEKGIHILAESFAGIHKRYPDVRLKLVGPAGLMPYAWIRAVSEDPLVASVKKYYGRGLLERFHREILQRGSGYLDDVKRLLGRAIEATEIHPSVPYRDIPEIFRQATILVSPSVCDECPAPVWEAMASGLAVVLTYEADSEGVLENGDTVLRVRRNDPGDLENAVCELLENPHRRQLLGRNARAAILKSGSWSKLAEKLIGYYEEALAEKCTSLHSQEVISGK